MTTSTTTPHLADRDTTAETPDPVATPNRVATDTQTATSEPPAAVWTIDAVRRLGATIDVETAGAILGIGRSKSYELAKNGQFPVKVRRIGRRYLIPTPAIHEYLGIK